jgi:DNA-binding transcriptional MerR regulator
MARLLPADLAARAAGVQPSTLRDWRRRGLIQSVGGTARHPLYDLAQLHAAKQASKPRRTAQTTQRVA